MVEGLPDPHLQDRRGRRRPQVPDRDRHHRPPREGARRPRLHRRSCTARAPTTPPSSAARRRRSRSCTTPTSANANAEHLGDAPLHPRRLALRPLHQGDHARQDRQLHDRARTSRRSSTAGSPTTCIGRDDAGQALKAQYPLREARVDVTEIPGKPGSYKAVVFLRPHFQLEELTTSIRLVAQLPPPAA